MFHVRAHLIAQAGKSGRPQQRSPHKSIKRRFRRNSAPNCTSRSSWCCRESVEGAAGQKRQPCMRSSCMETASRRHCIDESGARPGDGSVIGRHATPNGIRHRGRLQQDGGRGPIRVLAKAFELQKRIFRNTSSLTSYQHMREEVIRTSGVCMLIGVLAKTGKKRKKETATGKAKDKVQAPCIRFQTATERPPPRGVPLAHGPRERRIKIRGITVLNTRKNTTRT